MTTKNITLTKDVLSNCNNYCTPHGKSVWWQHALWRNLVGVEVDKEQIKREFNNGKLVIQLNLWAQQH